MMSHIDAWATLATMVGLDAAAADWVGDDGKPIYFDSIDNSAYVLGKAAALGAHSAGSTSTARSFSGVRADVSGDPEAPLAQHRLEVPLHRQGLLARAGAEPRLDRGSLYNLTMDPFEKYDMIFNGAVSTPDADDLARPLRRPGQRLGRGAGLGASMVEFNQSIIKYPSLPRVPGGASDDLC